MENGLSGGYSDFLRRVLSAEDQRARHQASFWQSPLRLRFMQASLWQPLLGRVAAVSGVSADR